MFKFNFENTSINISLPCHISNDIYKIITNDGPSICFHEKKKEKRTNLNCKITMNKVCIATQASEPPSCYIRAFINSLC